MFEVVVLFLFVAAAWVILPSFFKPRVVDHSIYLEQLKIPQDSVLKRHFIAHLKSEIESSLYPCPTDPKLRQRYDAQVAAELKNRLARAI
ncbi:hypothetical protein BCS42_13550 [Crenothrix sp. D3]|jgi:hypothetical protein|nr:hypothetical protein BCS42_13550 [Crenothrix sp. D3]